MGVCIYVRTASVPGWTMVYFPRVCLSVCRSFRLSVFMYVPPRCPVGRWYISRVSVCLSVAPSVCLYLCTYRLGARLDDGIFPACLFVCLSLLPSVCIYVRTASVPGWTMVYFPRVC